ncbi:hypothetical protein BMF94_4715 [Rhodotorula taiwanensis]|uniref:Uncharacterized protein n=1 Tax=Rhodotorula taiwanensis TaxID=741276 RepID=A0A2S5B609_9BASI|nr:hypothetical protein BMF94_4715 [Rhodotorula taiwanensis]
MHASISSLSAIALVASVLVSQSAQALPMTRSSSSVARRAHIASHQHVARDSYLGDHAIVVDASSSGAYALGGIRNSTVNLTNISKKRAATLSTFSRVVRSLFGGDRPEREPLPLTFSPYVATAAARTAVTVAPHSAATTVAANPKRRRSTRQKRHRARAFGKHPRPQPAKPQAAPPLVVRNVKRDATQASIYSAAVAALPESTPTAAAVEVLAAAAAIPTLESKLTSPYNGSALDAPNGSYGNAAAARARGFSTTVPSSVSVASRAATALTDDTPAPTPLVSVDANGVTWVPASNVAVPTATGATSSSSTATTVLNPKNYVAAAAPTVVVTSSSSPVARVAVSTGSSATVVLPTSPPPSTMTGTSFARRA